MKPWTYPILLASKHLDVAQDQLASERLDPAATSLIAAIDALRDALSKIVYEDARE